MGTSLYSFEWTPGQEITNNPLLSAVEGATATDKPLTFTFTASDGKITTVRTEQVSVFDVSRQPEISASNHAVVVGEALSLQVRFGSNLNPG